MISIIIPILNEEKVIQKSIERLFDQNENFEIIVVDGGSTDKTLEKINSLKSSQKRKIKVITSKIGRAKQMNAGARKASGETLLFLHVDCTLPQEALSIIQQKINEGCVGGGFLERYLEKNLLLKFVAFRSNFRSKIFKIFFGDQAMFVKKDVFDGFKDVPIMEDLEFSSRLKKKGKVDVISERVTLSGRNYLEKGVLKLILVYFVLMCMYHLGFDFEKIKKMYSALAK